MEINFKFEIGDIVYHRLKGGLKIKKTPLLIVSRVAEECTAGVQLHYICRLGLTKDSMSSTTLDYTNTYRFHEIELEVDEEE